MAEEELDDAGAPALLAGRATLVLKPAAPARALVN
jgi:hypothetical protein